MKRAFRSLSFLSFGEADLGGESASLSDSVQTRITVDYNCFAKFSWEIRTSNALFRQ